MALFSFRKKEEEDPLLEKKSAMAKSTSTEDAPVSLFSRLKQGLSKTRKTFSENLETIFSAHTAVNDEVLDNIETLFITSDMGFANTQQLITKIKQQASQLSSMEEVKTFIQNELIAILHRVPSVPISYAKPHVIMVLGVNGVGKTTTVGKLAKKFADDGKSVLIAAADTFRAAAPEQLAIWAKRANAQLVRSRENADPSSVVYDSLDAALARNIDVVLIDTAGRLHTKSNLMEELKKIKRTISKKIPDAPHETFLVLDSTTGQNAISQAQLFHKDIGVTGLVITKLDGTAKGGIVFSVSGEIQAPLRYIGVGEQVEDLQEFHADEFVQAFM